MSYWKILRTIKYLNFLNIRDIAKNKKLEFEKKDIWSLVWPGNNNLDLNNFEEKTKFHFYGKK